MWRSCGRHNFLSRRATSHAHQWPHYHQMQSYTAKTMRMQPIDQLLEKSISWSDAIREWPLPTWRGLLRSTPRFLALEETPTRLRRLSCALQEDDSSIDIPAPPYHHLIQRHPVLTSAFLQLVIVTSRDLSVNERRVQISHVCRHHPFDSSTRVIK
jgi:hypothetical protein